MEKAMNYITGFFGGLMSVMMAILPVTILWFVLTGGFTGLVVLILVASFFTKE